MRDRNREQLIAAAELLRPLLSDLVFVGGCITGILITDDAAPEPRATFDVDAIVEITSYARYTAFSERLGNSDSPMILAKEHRYAAGFMGPPLWTSCRLTRRSSGSRISGIAMP